MRFEAFPNVFLFVIILRSLHQLPEMVGAEIVFPYLEGEKDREAQRGQVTSSRLLSVLVPWPALELGSPWDRGVAFDAAVLGMRTYILIAMRASAYTIHARTWTPGKHDHTGASCTCTRACEHTHTHTSTHVHIQMLYLRWLSRTAARPWTSLSPRERGGPLRGKKRKGSGYLEGRMDGALSLPGGGVRGTCWRPPGWGGEERGREGEE